MLSLVLFALGASAQPPIPQHVAYARWMVQNITWGVMSTVSTLPGIAGSPFGNPVSFADSGDGTPVFCVSGLDQSIKDVQMDPRMSLTMSEAGSTNDAACSSSLGGDAENPPCSRLVVSGTFEKVTDDDEWANAARALNATHPAMDEWGCFGGDSPHGHDFFLAKLHLSQVWLINMYGGAAVINASEYFSQQK